MDIKRYSQIRESEENHWWYNGRRKLLSKLVSSTTVNAKNILDYGCGTGFNLELLRKFGNVWGVDIEPLAIKYSQSRGFKRVILIDKEKRLPFRDNQFEIITCLDVLEHVDKPDYLLDEFNRILNKGGYLIVFVPAFPILWSRLDDYSHHLKRYTRKVLKENFSRHDFKPVKIFYFNYLFFIPILVVRLFQKLNIGHKNDWGIYPVVKSHWWGKILEKFFWFDVISSMIISPPFGVSLAALYQKK